MSDQFEVGTRNNGDSYFFLKSDAPKWMQNIVFESHNAFDLLPNDRIYTLIANALDAIVEGLDDIEFADYAVSVYNHDRTSWLAENQANVSLVDQAVEEYGNPGSVIEAIGYGQNLQAAIVFNTVMAGLEAVADES